MQIGYTLMGEQSGPKDLVRDAQRAEQWDSTSPWPLRRVPGGTAQGHSPYVWSVLGAVAQVTDRLPLMTFVTCPIRRYHPVVVAQKAATMQLLSEGRFTLGLGVVYSSSTSMWWVEAGPVWTCATGCCARQSRSSWRRSPGVRSATAATITTWTPP